MTWLIPVSSPRALSPDAFEDFIWKVLAPIATLKISKEIDGTKFPSIFSNRGRLLIIESFVPILILPIPDAELSKFFKLV